MSNKKDFEELYEEIKQNDGVLKEHFDEMQKERKKNKIVKTIVFICIFAIFVYFGNLEIKKMMVIDIYSTIIINIIILLFSFVISTLIASFFFSKSYKEYNREFKNQVINKIINNFYSEVNYKPEEKMPENIYEATNYDENYDIYDSEDYIEGKLDNNYNIQMAEIETKKEEETRDSDGHTDTYYVTVFHGLFEKIVIDKSINCNMKISIDGQTWKNKDKVEMDSSEFEKYFDVSSTNKIIAMQILTADIMEKLIDFRNKTNMDYDIIINNNTIYIRYFSGEMFETGNYKKGLYDEELLKKYFYMLNFTYNLAHELINVINEKDF